MEDSSNQNCWQGPSKRGLGGRSPVSGWKRAEKQGGSHRRGRGQRSAQTCRNRCTLGRPHTKGQGGSLLGFAFQALEDGARPQQGPPGRLCSPSLCEPRTKLLPGRPGQSGDPDSTSQGAGTFFFFFLVLSGLG